MLNLVKGMVPAWMMPVAVLLVVGVLTALLLWRGRTIDHLEAQNRSLTADIARYQADLDYITAARAAEEAVQLKQVVAAQDRLKRKADIDARINSVPRADCNPALRRTVVDSLYGVTATAAAGDKGKAAGKPAALR